MTATFSGQIVMAGFIDLELKPWMRVGLTRAIALGPAVAVCLATGSDTALFNNINQWLNILQAGRARNAQKLRTTAAHA
jgi:natural resistance-associated macrophage protein